MPTEYAEDLRKRAVTTADPVPRPKGRIWHACEIAQLRVVLPSIDGPNLCLVIRFEREGEERFARWVGDPVEWREPRTLDRLFATAGP